MADFQIANYEMDDGTFRPIKVAAFTISTINPNAQTEGTGSFVRAGGSTRRYGTVARQVSLSRQIGVTGAYSQATVSVTIPILTTAAFAALSIGETVTYNELEDWIVTGKKAEATR